MPTITKKQLENYQQLCSDRNNGRILTPDGLQLICESYKNDPETVRNYMLGILARIQNEGRFR